MELGQKQPLSADIISVKAEILALREHLKNNDVAAVKKTFHKKMLDKFNTLLEQDADHLSKFMTWVYGDGGGFEYITKEALDNTGLSWSAGTTEEGDSWVAVDGIVNPQAPDNDESRTYKIFFAHDPSGKWLWIGSEGVPKFMKNNHTN